MPEQSPGNNFLEASTNSPTAVELIVDLIGELLYCNYLEFLKDVSK